MPRSSWTPAAGSSASGQRFCEAGMRVVVCTVVHHPMDARILHRQIRALLDAGHQVSYIAPLRACGVAPWPGVTAADVPRAVGRSRLAALPAAPPELARRRPRARPLTLPHPTVL